MLRVRRELRGHPSAAWQPGSRARRRDSGFSALVYEVAWTRLLALVIGPTTYAFATMAAAFITGLAIGSALGTPLARARPRIRRRWLAPCSSRRRVGRRASPRGTPRRAMPLSVAAQVADPVVAFDARRVAQALDVGADCCCR